VTGRRSPAGVFRRTTLALDQSPILFYLLGSVSDPSSVVLAELQLLDFLAAVIAKTPPLPNDLNAALTNGRLFLFLGFGLQQWYLRILLHVLKVLRGGSRSFAVEFGEEDLHPPVANAILFYRQNFKVDVYEEDVFTFVEELRGRYRPLRADRDTTGPGDVADSKTPPDGSRVFICHASEDAEHARSIHDTLVRAGLNPWLDQEALRGGDRWDSLIEETIRGVDYFVVINSRHLEEKSRGASYVNKEIKTALNAEEWRFGKFIIPVRVDANPLLGALTDYHAIDLTVPEGARQLVRAIKRQSRGS